jgi:hypothetical protein
MSVKARRGGESREREERRKNECNERVASTYYVVVCYCTYLHKHR